MSHIHPATTNSNVNTNHDATSINVTIRFSASLPDLPLSLPCKPQTTTSTLKQLIRASIPAEYSNRRIRLIHSGKALVDDAPLISSLRLPSQPPSRVATPVTPSTPYEGSDAEGTGPVSKTSKKGKAAIRNPPLIVPPLQRIYIHCSIGDVVLTPSELAAEAALANQSATHTVSSVPESNDKQDDHTTTTPAPRGFDRLLSAGFAASEVQSLRLQFMAIQSHTHTPDTMPSPNTLRDMEDQWLDNDRANNANGTGAGGAPGMSDEDAQAGALDDMIWGLSMGFFWPVGCLMWGTREEGIWSQRRKMAIAVGVALNIGLGFVRYTS